MRLLLTGNPNVGKSAVFGHLTGVSVTTSNYPGTTVNYTKGFLTYGGERHEVIDVPGIYQLDPEAEAEKVAVEMIADGDVLINVVDSTNLERNLNLTLQLAGYGKPMVLLLNMSDDAKHKGIYIDAEKLSDILGVDVIRTNGATGEGIKEIPGAVFKARKLRIPELSEDKRWAYIGGIIKEVQNLKHRHHTFIEKLQDLSIHPVYGPFIAVVVLVALFRLIISAGEFLTERIGALFEFAYSPFIRWLSGIIGGDGILHSLLLGDLGPATAGIDYEAAMGVLTTGVFVALGIVMPYIILFYLVFGFLEDLGYLPRAAVILDRLLHKVGLHGYSVIPMLLACGCNVPGVLAVRNLETRRERFITAVIMCTTIPCMAQTSLIIRAAGERGGIYIALVFATLLTVWAVLGMFLKETVKGLTPTLLMEVPPYRLPGLRLQLKKLGMRLRCFLKEAIPYVMGGILLINLMYVSGIISWIGNFFSPIVKGVLGLPEETVSALIIGLLRKDAAVALLEPLKLTDIQIVKAVVVLTLYFPCVATFTVLIKELGIKDAGKAVLIMFAATLSAGAFLNLAGRLMSPYFMVLSEILLIAVMSFVIPVLSGIYTKYRRSLKQ
ncbi:MAG: ferrous iron transporter B [Eubacteriales bacterium]|nr:ferrous iron transporter B [Eubacteriales bacterium]